MTVIINGKESIIPEKTTLATLIKEKCLDPQRVITEVNEKIVKREHWADYSLKEGDQIELVTFVGGG